MVMITRLTHLLILATALGLATGVRAKPTEVTVHVLSRDAKFVGTSMGGARVIIENVQTGEVLAQGLTEGGTGDTELIIQRDRKRDVALPTGDAARFTATLDLDAPTKIRVTAHGPADYPGSSNSVSATQWVLPGKSINKGNGWLLELPGLVVDLHDTPSSVRLAGGKADVPVRATVQMMCGCPLIPNGLWDSEQFEIVAHVLRDGKEVQKIALDYAGEASEFEGKIPLTEAGVYQLSVWAYQSATGNSGLDTLQVVVTE